MFALDEASEVLGTITVLDGISELLTPPVSAICPSSDEKKEPLNTVLFRNNTTQK